MISRILTVAETGLIDALGGLMLRRACSMRPSGPTTFASAVNLSPLQFRGGNLLPVVMDALKQSGLPPSGSNLRSPETLLPGKEQPGAGHLPRCAPLACASRG